MPTKYKLFPLSFCLLAFSSLTCQAETFNGPTTLEGRSFDELIINGPAELKKVKAKKLTVHGPLKFYEVEISGPTNLLGPAKGKKAIFQDISASGPFKAEKVVIEALKVSGPAHLEEFTVEGQTNIQGPLKAQKGVFGDLIAGSKAGGESVSLHDVVAKDVTINRGNQEEILKLSGETVIRGKITFESGKGKVEEKGKKSPTQGTNS